MTISIHLTKGYIAIVDEIDADLAGLKWHVRRNGRKFYAVNKGWRKSDPVIVMHRIIAERINGGEIPGGLVVDHKNGITTDNRRENIRLATPTENNRNREMNRNNKVGFKGVHPHNHANRWTSAIRLNNTTKYLGCFDTPVKAHAAYCAAALANFGEWANFGSDSPFTGWTLIDFERGYKQLELPFPVAA